MAGDNICSGLYHSISSLLSILAPSTHIDYLMASTSVNNDNQFCLRVSGLGHSLTLEIPSNSSIRELKQRIEVEPRVPIEYQRLLARGSDLEDEEISLEGAKVKNRTKIMLLHNVLYSREKSGFEALSKIGSEIEELATRKDELSPIALSELVTRICCKLDEVETKGSPTLRARRKELLRNAEALDGTSK